MIGVYLFIVGIFLMGFVCARLEKIERTETTAKIALPFLKLASYILRKKVYRREKVQKRQLQEKLRVLNPTADAKLQAQRFLTERIAFCLQLLFIGNFLCICIWISGYLNVHLTDEIRIKRNEYGQGDLYLTLLARVGEEDKGEIINYTVKERIYSQKELEKLYDEATMILENSICENNTSLEDIRFPINLPTSIDGYPFVISWESDKYSLVDTSGKVNNEELQTGEIVSLTAHFRYEDWRRDFLIHIQVNPVKYTPDELQEIKLQEALSKQDLITKTDSNFILPKQLEDQEIFWQEKQTQTGKEIFALMILVIVILYISKDREIDTKLEERREQLLMDYPEIVNKLVLYMGAGMTIRAAFVKMGQDYKKQAVSKKRYAYEEILLACYELQSGKAESEAYTQFGKRCQLQVYVKLGTLLTQNLKKGSNNLLPVLRKEIDEAFLARKNLARKFGEEAGTKLLFPMMMMLCIVMVIIIVPAYFSFTV